MSGVHAPGKVWTTETGPSTAPLVVLVHGSMDRSAGVLRTSRRLDDRFRVARYDRRGYGRSASLAGPYGMDAQVADLASVVGDRRAVIVGHSYGGNVALAFAARHRASVRAVAVYEAPLSWLEWWPGTTAGGRAVATSGDPGEAAERFMRRLVGDARWERLPPSTRQARRVEGVAMVGELSDLRERPPWRPDEIVVPVLAMYGEHGAEHHRRATEHLGSTLPNCRTLMIEGARHFGPNTHPDQVAAAVDELSGRAEATMSAIDAPASASATPSEPPTPTDS